VRRLAAAAALALPLLAVCAAYADDTPKAAATRELIKKTKLSLEVKDQRLEDAMDALKEEVKDKTGKTLTVIFDGKGGVSKNQKVSVSAKDKTIEEILDAMFKPVELGYFIDQSKSYDGSLKVVKGKARGYEEGKEPKDKDAPAKDK
jgi:hypothetical protein